MEYLPEQRGKTSLTRGAARNVKSSKQKKAFSNGLMNSTIFYDNPSGFFYSYMYTCREMVTFDTLSIISI